MTMIMGFASFVQNKYLLVQVDEGEHVKDSPRNRATQIISKSSSGNSSNSTPGKMRKDKSEKSGKEN